MFKKNYNVANVQPNMMQQGREVNITVPDSSNYVEKVRHSILSSIQVQTFMSTTEVFNKAVQCDTNVPPEKDNNTTSEKQPN